MSSIGFIGTGTMGRPISRRLLEAGHELVVFDVIAEASAPLVEDGALLAESPTQVAEACRIVFTSLPGPAEVEDAVTGPQGILIGAREGDIHVDLSTNAYEAIRRLHELESRAGVQLIDAPVSGGVAGAERGTLAVMASGDRAAFERIEPILLAFSKKVFHLGEVGTGTLTKLVNNLIFLCGGILVQEGLVLAAKAGLDSAQLLGVLKESSASAYTGLAGLFLGRDFENAIFKLGIAEKDVALALESARELGVPMPMTEAGHAVYQRAREGGLGDEVFYATLKTLEEAAGVENSESGGER
jgi:3-hydroxyisobutyrate dehydrogenase-like beta-hydroxyacid dehydrogenase